MLGQRIDTVAGHACNVYFEGLLPQQPTEAWEVSLSCELGQQLADRWTFTPTTAQIGIHAFALRYRDPHTGKTFAAACELHVHSGEAGREEIRWLPIGDSITAAALYVEATAARGLRIGTAIKSLGTRFHGQNGITRNEGYPGWKFGDFLGVRGTLDANFREQVESAFCFAAGPIFNFAKYQEVHLSGEEPDFITVFLGTNDIGLLDDATRGTEIARSIGHAETIIDSLVQNTSKTRIGVIPPLLPADQNAFGLNYGCLLPRWLYRKNQRAIAQALQEKFAEFHERVSVIPAHFQIDSLTGYPMRQERVNPHSDQTRTINTNAVHPSPVGHHQIADAILAWMAGRRDFGTP